MKSINLEMREVLYGIFFMLLTFGTCSCKSDEESKSGKDILISNSWKVYSYKINGGEIALEDCQKDDYFTFTGNGTYNDFRGPLKCPGEIQTDVSGTWTLSQDEKTLTLTSIQGASSFGVVITENKLEFTFTEDDDIMVLTCVPYM